MLRSPLAILCCAAVATTMGGSAGAQIDHGGLPVRSGAWTYSATAIGSQAVFADASRQSLITVRCTRATRRISIDVRSVAVPSLLLWTTTASRQLLATHNPATGLVTAELPAWDNLVDAVAFSRGRFSVSAPGSPPVVVPAWPEPARAIEDCRN